jgi:hypothetical protein
MNNKIRLPLILLALALLLVLAGCTTIPNMEEGLVIGNNYKLAAGQTLNHDLTVIGGNAVLEEDSTVNGDVSIMGGTVRIDGLVNGDVSVMGGSVRLDDKAVVRGDLNQLGGSIDKSASAQVDGGSTDFDNPSFGSTTMRAPKLDLNFDPITGPIMAIFQALALAALAMLVQLFAPSPTLRVGQAVQTAPLIAGGIGLLTILVGPALLVIVSITIILLPVGLLGFLLLGIAVVFGWLSLGLLTGQHLARLFKQTWTDPICAGVGALALSLVASMANLIWCIGWFVPILISTAGLGAVILTRFGTRTYVLATPAPYSPAPAAVMPAAGMPAAGSVPAAVNTVTEPGTGARIYQVPGTDEPQTSTPDLFDAGPNADDSDQPQI